MKNVFFVVLIFLHFSARAEIPSSLLKLASVKDKKSDAYLFLSQEAAIDTKNSAERMLDGENSAGALKILEVAVHLMPHRTDLNSLRSQALKTYVDITKKLEEDSTKNCGLLQERYQFLKNIAPDALARLKLERSCAPDEKMRTLKTDEALLQLPEPKPIKALEEEFKPELVKTFPWDDVLANSFMLFRSLFGEEFKIVCEGFAEEKIKCTQPRPGEDFVSVSQQYCGYIEGLLHVSHGEKSILCTYNKSNVFKTTVDLYQIYAKVFDNHAFDDDIPTYAVMDVTLKYLNRAETRSILVKLNSEAFRKGELLTVSGKKGGVLESTRSLDFSLTTEETKGLHDVSMVINFKRTYELYQQSFKEGLKRPLPIVLEEKF